MTGLVPEPVDGVPCETTPPAAPVPGPQRRGETGTDTGPAADDGDVPSPVAARDDVAALVGVAAPDAVVVPPPAAVPPTAVPPTVPPAAVPPTAPPTAVPPTAPPAAVPDPRTEPGAGPARSLTPEQGLMLEAEGFAYAVARGVGAPDARYFAKVASRAAVTRVPPRAEKTAIGYTIRAVRNQIADLRRTHPREVPVERFPDRATGDTTAEQVIRRDEVRRALRMVRELLTERQFEVCWLRRVKEMTLDETADILGIRPGTVAATLNKAERKIGRHLARQGARAPGRQRRHRG